MKPFTGLDNGIPDKFGEPEELRDMIHELNPDRQREEELRSAHRGHINLLRGVDQQVEHLSNSTGQEIGTVQVLIDAVLSSDTTQPKTQLVLVLRSLIDQGVPSQLIIDYIVEKFTPAQDIPILFARSEEGREMFENEDSIEKLQEGITALESDGGQHGHIYRVVCVNPRGQRVSHAGKIDRDPYIRNRSIIGAFRDILYREDEVKFSHIEITTPSGR